MWSSTSTREQSIEMLRAKGIEIEYFFKLDRHYIKILDDLSALVTCPTLSHTNILFVPHLVCWDLVTLGARQGDTLYYIQSEACTCTMNARIHATKYAQSQMLSCSSCQCHLCRRGHTGVRTMELYEPEALSMSLAPHEALCCHFHVCTIGNRVWFQLIIWAIKPE